MTEKRRFTGSPAVRSSVPLWIGLYGPSGSGKTYSALRLARGIQSVSGGKIGGGDTENGRMKHYASEFEFQHYDFAPPFDPLSYLDLLEQMQNDGIAVAIIDSASHEHEGPGGVLEMHEAETDRLAKLWKTSHDKAQMSGWAKPKKERRQMIQGALRLPMHTIWCFRAKEKLAVKSGKNPTPLGFMPIAAEELVYEMAMTALLMPGAYGVPTWKSEEQGEKQMIKLPHWAKAMLRSGAPLDEELGAALARWARGDKPSGSAVATLLAAYEQCTTADALSVLEEQRRAVWKAASAEEKQALKAMADATRARIAKPTPAPRAMRHDGDPLTAEVRDDGDLFAGKEPSQ